MIFSFELFRTFIETILLRVCFLFQRCSGKWVVCPYAFTYLSVYAFANNIVLSTKQMSRKINKHIWSAHIHSISIEIEKLVSVLWNDAYTETEMYRHTYILYRYLYTRNCCEFEYLVELRRKWNKNIKSNTHIVQQRWEIERERWAKIKSTVCVYGDCTTASTSSWSDRNGYVKRSLLFVFR